MSFSPPRWLRFLTITLLVAAAVTWAGVVVKSFGIGAASTAALPTPVSPASVSTSPVAFSPSLAGTATLPAPSLPAVTTPMAPNPPASLPASPAASPSAPTPKPSISPSSTVQTKYRHFPYQENSSERLVAIGRYYDRAEYLDQEAAVAFKQMVLAARAEGAKIVPISGFRTIQEQQGLFQRQIQRQGSPERAAMLSAPAGYSEHHTGYALDIGDGNSPNTDLRYDFEQTEAYRWLKQQAKSYGFELSFPDQNPQGISFEPWHWRYIGSSRAQGIFAAARQGR
jgi:zinc D-Ala-D-Ala carboxypeptidase